MKQISRMAGAESQKLTCMGAAARLPNGRNLGRNRRLASPPYFVSSLARPPSGTEEDLEKTASKSTLAAPCLVFSMGEVVASR